MAVRKRFNADERDLLSDGVVVDWQNVAVWGHPVLVKDATIRVRDGWQYVIGEHLTSRGTVRKGDTIWVSPGKLRRMP